MKLGILGLPNVGKSTLFNAITAADVEAENYPFCTIEPNVGVVPVPDPRLDAVFDVIRPKERAIYAIVEFVDIAGLVEGASKGEGLGNQFLSHVREMDALMHVVRCFDDPQVVHINGMADPERDIEIINSELILSDLEQLERRRDRTARAAKSGDKQKIAELDLIDRLIAWLDQGQSARQFEMTEDEKQLLRDLPLLSAKPILYVANISEEMIGEEDESPHVQAVREIAKKDKAEVIVVSAKIESEIALLEGDERAIFLEELGLKESGLDLVIRAGYELLGLISYFTAGEKQVRAWTIKRGTKAPGAAGVIHSDFERGFIRAEVVRTEDLLREGSMSKCREKGLLRSEGKDYVVEDADVILFRFNV